MYNFEFDEYIISSINNICEFLSFNQSMRFGVKEHFDLVILCGNEILSTATGAFGEAKRAGVPVLVTGGIGHATALLAEAAALYYPHIKVHGRPEAEILRDIATSVFNLENDQVIVEADSKNGGENALFSFRRLDELGLRPQAALLVQDPLMQRRADASFRKVWLGGGWRTEFLNWSTFTPRLDLIEGSVEYGAELPRPLWAKERFISLLLGEIPRLRDDEYGYGPRGRGFISHVSIPAEVERDFRVLVAHFEGRKHLLSRWLA